jgi:Sulfatase-modifying factor enzyme 1
MDARTLNQRVRSPYGSVTRGLLADLAILVALGCVACDDPAPPATTATTASAPVTAGAGPSASSTPATTPSTEPSASAAPRPPPDLRPLLLITAEQLIALLPGYSEQARGYIEKHIEPGGFAAMNQGNPELAMHTFDRISCLRGLETVTLQSDADRALCGHDRMVPIYADGDRTSAKACIDIFEFPNRACELPFVWASPTIAHGMCKKLGKRLCKQQEWMVACEADPAGGEARKYSYGDRLDLDACNTSRTKKGLPGDPCDPTTVKTTWETCRSNTAPSGAFPRCRSRLGVYDLQGNVAEAMTRYDAIERKTVSQLKGSAFFYVDVHRKLSDKPEKVTYPDHCRHDPRWHVQDMDRAWHVNYHLGFRCCADIKR